MHTFLLIIGILLMFVCLTTALNHISYQILKKRIIAKRKTWGLNICCGFTDGGGVNADVVQFANVPNFVLLKDVYHLPFADKQFDSVLCSHTLEHVDDPERFFAELQRVGKEVVLILPPLWDISAALNILEHRHIFLTLKKEHRVIPPYIVLPLAALIQRWRGQRMHA
ncbi:MAG: class I SAM-dependent methyltransferase [Patescibacteria group bacterium]